jgi:hypothetical protein
VSDRLPEDKLNKLLPCLGPLAELISIGKKIDRQTLFNITAEMGINREEWAFAELELWGSILSKCKNKSYTKDDIVTELRNLGIPEFPAMLAYESTKPKPMTIEPIFVDFGCLQIGEVTSKTLQASGEPIVEVIGSSRVKVTLLKSGSNRTLVKLQLGSGSGGESIKEEVILRGSTGEARVTVTARWEKEPPLLSWCPIHGDTLGKKSLFYNKYTKKYECLYGKEEYPYPDKRVTEYNKTRK